MIYKAFIPKNCPECGNPLSIVKGKSDTTKLVCTNKGCSGILLKRLQKGIVALEIRGIGPKIIEKLVDAGITHSFDLFDKNKFNEDILCASGLFRKGRALEKLIDSVDAVTEIPIKNAILSLQLQDIGKTFSEKIGRMISGADYDFTGLQRNIREDMNIKGVLYQTIQSSLEKFREFGITIKDFEKPKVIVAKKVMKKVDATFEGSEMVDFIKTILDKLDWDLTDVKNSDCKMLVVEDKNEDNEKVRYAKENNIKIMTLKQIKILFL